MLDITSFRIYQLIRINKLNLLFFYLLLPNRFIVPEVDTV